jgi:hypothetical protein
MQFEGRITGDKLVIEIPIAKLRALPTQWQPRDGTKHKIMLDLVRRREGASLAELLGRVVAKAGYVLERKKAKGGVSRYYAKRAAKE